jgi:hypothetical protein
MKNQLENILPQQGITLIHDALEKYAANQQPIDDFLYQFLIDSNAYSSEADIKQTVVQISPTIDAISLACIKTTSASFLQMRKFLKQPTRRISLDSPHNFTGCHIGWRTYQNMHMILANHSAHYPYLERFAHLTYHCPNSFCIITCQNFVAIFCHPNKVLLTRKAILLPYL